jgi:thiosulfate/3-mercaptopyruvate sulfurtransferase
MRRSGVSGSRPVVVYDARDGRSAAARAWWLLEHFGHEDVRVLDGGLSAWNRNGFPLSGRRELPASGDFTARRVGGQLVDAAGAAAIAERGVLLDVRSRERFLGETEPYFRVAGHIPGAVSAPADELVDEHGQLLPARQLRHHFEELGVRDGIPVGAYCGAGVTAAQTMLALRVAGLEGALYVGSWSDWIEDPTHTIATGNR